MINMSSLYIGCFTLPKKTLEIVKNRHCDAVIQVKSNQKKLYKEIKKLCKTKESLWIDKTIDKWHWRVEERTVEIFDWESMTKDTDRWNNLISSVIKVTRNRIKISPSNKEENKKSVEISYYVSTNKYTAKQFQTFIREHRWVENRLHYVKDETMKEDKSRIRIKADHRARFLNFWFNVLRANWITNMKKEFDENRMSFDNIISKYLKYLI